MEYAFDNSNFDISNTTLFVICKLEYLYPDLGAHVLDVRARL